MFVCIRMQQQRPESPEPSCVSMKSDWSMDRPINFQAGQPADGRWEFETEVCYYLTLLRREIRFSPDLCSLLKDWRIYSFSSNITVYTWIQHRMKHIISDVTRVLLDNHTFETQILSQQQCFTDHSFRSNAIWWLFQQSLIWFLVALRFIAPVMPSTVTALQNERTVVDFSIMASC